MGPDAEQLVRRYYLYGGLYTLAASIIWGINTLFLLDAGLTIAEVFLANAAFSAGTMLFEIPTGVVADTVGRRTSFLLSLAVLALTTLAYLGLAGIEAGLIEFAIVSVVMGLGFTFYSGAMEAWLVDGLRHHGYDGALDHIFARASTIGGAAMLVGTIGGGALGQIDLAVPFVVRSTLLVLLLALAWGGMHDLGFEPRSLRPAEIPREANRLAREGISFGWKNPSLRLLMLASAVQMGFFSWAFYAWQPYFLELLEQDVVWVAGVVAALLSLSTIAGNMIVEWITRFCGRRSTMFIGAAGVFTGALIGVGLVDSFVPALVLLCIAGVAMGVNRPVRQAFVHETVPSQQRATVVSFDSMVSGGGGVLGQTGLGAYADRQGFSAGYVLGGAFTLLALPILGLVRRQAAPADFFVGTATAEPGACTPPGLPAVAQVDSEAIVPG